MLKKSSAKHIEARPRRLGAPNERPAGKDPSQAGSFSSENYRVFELGPERDGMYDYALVSDPSATSLYVLARNVSRFEALYDAQVLQTLERRGFTGFLTRPRKTKQTECEYTPPPQ